MSLARRGRLAGMGRIMLHDLREQTPVDVATSYVGRGASIGGDCLSAFDNLYAARLASWVRSDSELTWLAPGTVPPLSASKVARWGQRAEHRLFFWHEVCSDPIGYAELNKMPTEPDQMWIGHCILDPAVRGQGLGERFVHGLLSRAFDALGMQAVVLVVFPDNAAAIRCYRKNGMIITGREEKHFKTTRRRHEFLRMGIDRNHFERLRAAGHWKRDPAHYVASLADARRGMARRCRIVSSA